MDTKPQNKNTTTAEPSKKKSKLTTFGAWMVIIGILLVGFSINKYFSKNKIIKNSIGDSSYSQTIQEITDQVIPKNGYEIKVKWGNIGSRLVEIGAIDLEKFKELYAQSGSLKPEELAILTTNSDSNIKITEENSHFILNMLWAFGLSQKTDLLIEGDMIKYGDYKKFASTGGWTIAAKPIDDFYSKFNLLNLTAEQEEQIKKIAGNVYRPCCNNSTAFPDCNHGMAALGLIEIMVANENSEQEIYNALKYFNSFWFNSSYLETAIYFKKIRGVDWNKTDAKEILSKEYSSASGWEKNIHKELKKYPDLLPKTNEGGGCGL